jgi:hypothetical protein
MGIDCTIKIANGESQLNIIKANLKNIVMIGRHYQGHILPCFIGYSPDASITSQMLDNMLEVLDKSDIFD